MKAVTFQKPLEYTLKTEGESWPQAGRIEGSLEVKAHGPAPEGSRIQVLLAWGDLKKVRAKAEGAFTYVSHALNADWKFPDGGKSIAYDWHLDLEHNAPISDNSKSLFLVFGHAPEPSVEGKVETFPAGFLQISVVPEPAVQELLKTLTTGFRFVVKTQKALKGGITETKLVPPDSKAFSSLEYLVLDTWFETGVLHLQYTFNVKKLEPGPGTMNMKKEKREVTQTFSPHDYRLPSGRLNFEFYEREVQKALSVVEAKL